MVTSLEIEVQPTWDEKPSEAVAEACSAPQVYWGGSPKGGNRELLPLRRIAVSVSSAASWGVPPGGGDSGIPRAKGSHKKAKAA